MFSLKLGLAFPRKLGGGPQKLGLGLGLIWVGYRLMFRVAVSLGKVTTPLLRIVFARLL